MGNWQSKAQLHLEEHLRQVNLLEKERIIRELSRVQDELRQRKKFELELVKEKQKLEAEIEKEKNAKNKEIVLDFQRKFFEFINKLEECGRYDLEEITDVMAVMSPLVGESGNLTTLKLEGFVPIDKSKRSKPFKLETYAQKQIEFETTIMNKIEFESPKLEQDELGRDQNQQKQSGTDSKSQDQPETSKPQEQSGTMKPMENGTASKAKALTPSIVIDNSFDSDAENEYEYVVARELYEASNN